MASTTRGPRERRRRPKQNRAAKSWQTPEPGPPELQGLRDQVEAILSDDFMFSSRSMITSTGRPTSKSAGPTAAQAQDVRSVPIMHTR
jgi:hypothetical protein